MQPTDEERLGWQEVERGAFDAAEDHFRRALDLDPSRPDSLSGLGLVYLSWGDLDEAEELFQLALLQAEKGLPRKKRRTSGRDPVVQPYLRALYHLAITYVRQDLWEESVEPLEQILAWDPEGMEGEAFPLLAEAYHRLGLATEAIYYYRAALDYDIWSWFSLGALYLSRGEVDEATTILRHAVNERPEAARWIAHFPKVVPLPNSAIDDVPFVDAVGYLVDHMDLWPASARAFLRQTLESSPAG